MNSLELFLFGTALLLITCVLLSKASGRFGIPTLVIFLGVGILAGSEGLGGIYFDNAYYAKTLGIVSLSFILFAGGLETNWKTVKPVLRSGISLATIGVIVTTVIVGVFAYYLLHLTVAESLLIGACISSTDAGAVFTVLRARNINLKNNLTSLLELESGSNDPMAVFLVTSILAAMKLSEFSFMILGLKLMLQMGMGLACGYAGGKLMVWVLNKLKLEFEGLYTVFSLAAVLVIYTVSQGLHGNGFLSVYVAGIVLGHDSFVFKKTLILFHDGVSWLMQSSMFLTLGLLIFPSKVLGVSTNALLISGFIIVVARPLSVFLSLSFSHFNWREKLLISWVGLRGAVPIIMATYPLVAGVTNADLIFNLVFFVAVISLMIQGTSISIVAKWLGLFEPSKSHHTQEYSTNISLKNVNYITIPQNSPLSGQTIVDLKLPQDLLIVLIERAGEVLIPRGATEVRSEDRLMIIGKEESLNAVRKKM